MLTPVTPRSKYLKAHQRRMRRKPTPAEEYMKELLCECKVKFRFQQCFYDQKSGKCYIADFWIPTYSVIVECDGYHHYTPEGLTRDRIRDRHFHISGIRTVRFKNTTVYGLTKKKLLSAISVN